MEDVAEVRKHMRLMWLFLYMGKTSDYYKAHEKEFVEFENVVEERINYSKKEKRKNVNQ